MKIHLIIIKKNKILILLKAFYYLIYKSKDISFTLKTNIIKLILVDSYIKIICK